MTKDIKRFGRDVEAELDRVFSTTLLMRLGKMARDIIYRRVKSGYGVSDDRSQSPSKKKLKPLSKSYMNYRSGVADFKAKVGRKNKRVRFTTQKPELGAFGSPRKSNLTLTGQMLESIGFGVVGNIVRVYVENTQRAGESITNAELAKKVSDQGRPFFALTSDEQKILIREIEREIRSLSRRLSKKR